MKKKVALLLAYVMILSTLSIPVIQVSAAAPTVSFHDVYNFSDGNVPPMPTWSAIPATHVGSVFGWTSTTIMSGQSAYDTDKVAKIAAGGIVPLRPNRIINDGSYTTASDPAPAPNIELVEFDFMFDSFATAGTTNLLFLQKAANDNDNSIAKITFDAAARTLTAYTRDASTQTAKTNTLLTNVQANEWHRIRLYIRGTNYKRMAFFVDGVKVGDPLYRFTGSNESKMSVLDSIKVVTSDTYNPVYIDNLVVHKTTTTESDSSSYVDLIDKGALVKYIRQAEQLDLSNYDLDRVDMLLTALDDAKYAYVNNQAYNPCPASEQTSVDTAANNLKNAINSLDQPMPSASPSTPPSTPPSASPTASPSASAWPSFEPVPNNTPVHTERVRYNFENGATPPGWTINSIYEDNNTYDIGKSAKLVSNSLMYLPPMHVIDPALVSYTENNKLRMQTIEFDIMFNTQNEGNTILGFGKHDGYDTFLTYLYYNRDNNGSLEIYSKEDFASIPGDVEEFTPVIEKVELGRWYRIKLAFLLSFGPNQAQRRFQYFADGIKKNPTFMDYSQNPPRLRQPDRKYMSDSIEKVDLFDAIKVKDGAVNPVYIDNFVVYIGDDAGGIDVHMTNKGSLISQIRQDEKKLKAANDGVGKIKYLVGTFSSDIAAAKAVYVNQATSSTQASAAATALKNVSDKLMKVRIKPTAQGEGISFTDQSGEPALSLDTVAELDMKIDIVSDITVSADNPAKVMAVLALYNKNGKVIKLATTGSKQIIEANKADTLLVSAFDLSKFSVNDLNGAYIKVFLWEDTGNSLPICTASEWFK